MKKMNYQTPVVEEELILSEEAVLLNYSGDQPDVVEGEDGAIAD